MKKRKTRKAWKGVVMVADWKRTREMRAARGRGMKPILRDTTSKWSDTACVSVGRVKKRMGERERRG